MKARPFSSSFIGVALFVSACGAPPADEREQLRVPPYEGFTPVAVALSAHCGSLDCHGSALRNLRIFGANGLRLSNKDLPGIAMIQEAEVHADYISVVALEPEILSEVYGILSANPASQDPRGNVERLTMIRKGRGVEHHKGGIAMTKDGPTDRCIVSWIKGMIDDANCEQAKEIARPDMPAMPAPMPTP